MSGDNSKAHDFASDFIEAEELTDADVATTIVDAEDSLSAISVTILEKEGVLQYLYEVSF